MCNYTICICPINLFKTVHSEVIDNDLTLLEIEGGKEAKRVFKLSNIFIFRVHAYIDHGLSKLLSICLSKDIFLDKANLRRRTNKKLRYFFPVHTRSEYNNKQRR